MKLARILIVSVLMLLAMHCLRSAFISFLGFDPKYYFGMIAIPVLALATYTYRRHLGPAPSFPGYSCFLWLMFGMIILLSAYGWFRGNLPRLILFDIGSLTILWCFLFLGRYDRVWQDLEKPLFYVLTVCAPLVLIGLWRPEVHITYDGIFEQQIGSASRWTVNTLAYNLRELLHIVPLCFALACTYPSWNRAKITGIAGMLYWFGLMLMFAKRGPSIQAIAYLGWATLLSSRFHHKVQFGLMMTVIILGAVAILSVGVTRLTVISDRYQETGNFFKNERYYEVGQLLNDFAMFDYLTGRGMGGYFEVSSDWSAGVEIVAQSGLEGRSHIHVGAFWPLLKGGIPFTILYASMFLRMLLPKGGGWIKNKYNFAALATMAVFGAFLIIHTAPTLSGPLQLMVVGLCCARFGTPVWNSQNQYIKND